MADLIFGQTADMNHPIIQEHLKMQKEVEIRASGKKGVELFKELYKV